LARKPLVGQAGKTSPSWQPASSSFSHVRWRAYLVEFLHEVVRAHVQHEAANECRIIGASLLDEQRDVLGIGAPIEALGDDAVDVDT
jgi:hypothetical protein